MASVRTNARPASARSSSSRKAPKANLLELASAAFHAVSKVAAKEGDRDELVTGKNYDVSLTITATIEGQTLSQSYDCNLSVGHDSQRAGSAPTADILLAYLLGQMNPAHREAAQRKMVADFAANDGSLPVDNSIRESAKGTLQQLRATQSTTVRGTVSCKYQASKSVALAEAC